MLFLTLFLLSTTYASPAHSTHVDFEAVHIDGSLVEPNIQMISGDKSLISRRFTIDELKDILLAEKTSEVPIQDSIDLALAIGASNSYGVNNGQYILYLVSTDGVFAQKRITVSTASKSKKVLPRYKKADRKFSNLIRTKGYSLTSITKKEDKLLYSDKESFALVTEDCISFQENSVFETTQEEDAAYNKADDSGCVYNAEQVDMVFRIKEGDVSELTIHSPLVWLEHTQVWGRRNVNMIFCPVAWKVGYRCQYKLPKIYMSRVDESNLLGMEEVYVLSSQESLFSGKLCPESLCGGGEDKRFYGLMVRVDAI
jgi:hypothetical protein